ncbi:MAG: serine/threonine protein kinase [Myxococcaceae bacterium]|nr:serine/threonine protein kinase [Myxococcaceae bacterium]
MGPLELEEEIGRGGMGRVFRARHVRLGRHVAVKFLPAEHAADVEARARFEREARALALLAHPGIVAVHDFGEDEGEPYLVMELVEGRPLAELLPLPPERAVRVAVQLCDALTYAHARGVVHRDVTPRNVLMGEDGQVKLADFGIARGASLSAVTAPHIAAGTPGYVAPEALTGAAPDPRMDVYAVGALLHAMVMGRPPGPGGVALPGPLGAVVRRATAPALSERYASAEAMRAELVRLAGRESLVTLPPDEALWLRAVAAVLTVASALVLWALVASLTPRVVAPNELHPLTMHAGARLADGRVVVRAHFDTAAVLGATAGLGVAFAVYGLLRRHWRREGLEVDAPDVPAREARHVVWLGATGVGLFSVRLAVEGLFGAETPFFMPLLGGALELATLYVLCLALLELQRRRRPLRREPALWLGALLMVLPPAVELARFLRAWRP